MMSYSVLSDCRTDCRTIGLAADGGRQCGNASPWSRCRNSLSDCRITVGHCRTLSEYCRILPVRTVGPPAGTLLRAFLLLSVYHLTQHKCAK